MNLLCQIIFNVKLIVLLLCLQFNKSCSEEYLTPSELTPENIDWKNLLPSKTLCGIQEIDSPSETRQGIQVNEYPWQALLYYSGLGSSIPRFFCNGVVISKRYVLTTAFCALRRLLNLEYVRLGEFDISKNGTDCVENSTNAKCTGPFINFNVEKVITHPLYKSDGRFPYAHDIGLIRLKNEITWSDYIRPICLPDGTPTIQDVGKEVFTSGWGAQSYGDVDITVKKKLAAVVISTQECQKDIKYNITTMICIKNKDSTIGTGDEGGPIMSFAPKYLRWYLIGLLDIGVDYVCNGPKVSDYVDWIITNLEP